MLRIHTSLPARSRGTSTAVARPTEHRGFISFAGAVDRCRSAGHITAWNASILVSRWIGGRRCERHGQRNGDRDEREYVFLTDAAGARQQSVTVAVTIA